jgi:NADH dehydrogenase
MSVRARTPVEVLVMGKSVFTQISGALAPLRDAVAQTLNRRSLDVSKESPQAYDLFKKTPVRELMEPIPLPLLKPDAIMRDVGQAFVRDGNEFFYVSSDGQTLEGVVTMTDLLRARSSGATAETRLSEFMTRNSVTVSADDSCATAGAALREYRLKTLPIVERKDSHKVIGCLRLRRLMAFLFKETERNKESQNPAS